MKNGWIFPSFNVFEPLTGGTRPASSTGRAGWPAPGRIDREVGKIPGDSFLDDVPFNVLLRLWFSMVFPWYFHGIFMLFSYVLIENYGIMMLKIFDPWDQKQLLGTLGPLSIPILLRGPQCWDWKCQLEPRLKRDLQTHLSKAGQTYRHVQLLVQQCPLGRCND